MYLDGFTSISVHSIRIFCRCKLYQLEDFPVCNLEEKKGTIFERVSHTYFEINSITFKTILPFSELFQ